MFNSIYRKIVEAFTIRKWKKTFKPSWKVTQHINTVQNVNEKK